MQVLTKVRLIGATLQPHALLCALYQEVADQFVGQIATYGKVAALRGKILEVYFFWTLIQGFFFI